MKNLFLLIAAFFVFSANAQERASSVVFKTSTGINRTSRPVNATPVSRDKLKQMSGNRTTSGSGYFYDYADSILGMGNDSMGTVDMWPDTTGLFGHGSSYLGYGVPITGYYYFTTVGTLFNPMDSVWVSQGNWIPPTSGYTIDSVTIAGTYGRPAGATYTDSIKLTFVYGNGQDTSNMPYNGFIDPTLLAMYGLSTGDTAWFVSMFWDSVLNAATRDTDINPAPVTYTFPLTAADTSVSNLLVRSYPVNIVVPAGNFTGMSLSFISGGSHIPFDTIQYTNGSFKYGCFRPAVSIASDTFTWRHPPHRTPTSDFLPGFFKTEGSTDGGWNDEYVPSIAWDASGLGGYTQPYVNFHAYRLAGTTETNPANKPRTVKVYPNPANDAATITIDVETKAEVSLSLINLMGQVVYKQHLDNVDHCKTIVNTSTFPAGVYFYTIDADGQRNNGQIIVAH